MRLFRPNVEKMVEKKDVSGLVKALGDKDPKVREAAAHALKEIKKWHDLEPILAAIGVHAKTVARLGPQTSRILVRDAVAEVSRKFDPSVAVDRLCAALADDSSEVRAAAARSLGDIGDARAVEPLLTALRGSSDSVRKAIASALGEIGAPRAIQALITLLEDEELEVYAAEGLQWARNPLAVEALCTALRSSHSRLRLAAVHALEWIRDPRAVEPLCAALKDEKPSVRQAAVYALGVIGDSRAIQPLTAAQNDSDSIVRHRALAALKEIPRGKRL